MTSSENVNYLALHSASSRHEYDRIAGILRKSRQIPVGARGLNAPHLQPHEASTLFIACIASKRPKDAEEVVKTYSNLMASNDCSTNPFQFDGDTFGEAMDEIFGSPSLANKLQIIEVCRSIPKATIKMRINKKDYNYSYRIESPEKDEPSIRSIVIVEGWVIHQLTLELKKAY